MRYRQIAAGAALMLVVAGIPQAYASASATTAPIHSDAVQAANWMLAHELNQDRAWTSISAYAGLGTFTKTSWTSKELSALASSSDYAKTILAIIAAGQDPHNYQGRNFVQALARLQLTSGPDAGKFADNVDGTGTDSIPGQAWSILALEAAGGVSYNRVTAGEWLLQHQGKDGGWSYSASASGSDPDDTAFVVSALTALGFTKDSAPIQSALTYLKTTQADDGGFGSGGSNSDSTAVVIDALAGLGIPADAWAAANGTPTSALLSFFDSASGQFRYDNSNNSWAGPNPFSTHDGLLGLGALQTGRSIFQRLHWRDLNWLNSYWSRIYAAGGAWSHGKWLTWGELRPMAVAGSYLSDLTPQWQAVVKAHGMYVKSGNKSVWEAWDSHLATLALQDSFGANTMRLNGLE